MEKKKVVRKKVKKKKVNPADKILSDREELYCQYYMVYHVQSRAYIEAGYSATSAYSHASELHKKPHIQRRLNELRADRAEIIKPCDARALELEMNILNTSITDFYEQNENEHMVLKDLSKLPKYKTDALEGVEFKLNMEGKNQISKIKMVPKQKQLEMYMKRRGMLQDVSIEINETIGIEFEMVEAKPRPPKENE